MQTLITRKSEEIDFNKLMDIYEESNWENLSMVKSDIDEKSDKNILYQKVRQAYTDYLKNDFLKSGKNYIAILIDDKSYLSALRLYDEGKIFLLEALETNPSFRRKGYGGKLLSKVLDNFANREEIRSEVGKNNKKSLNLHKKLGFKIKEEREKNYLLVFKEDS